MGNGAIPLELLTKTPTLQYSIAPISIAASVTPRRALLLFRLSRRAILGENRRFGRWMCHLAGGQFKYWQDGSSLGVFFVLDAIFFDHQLGLEIAGPFTL